MRFWRLVLGGLTHGRQRLVHGMLFTACLDLVQPIDLSLPDLFAHLEQVHSRGLVVAVIVDSDDNSLFPFDLHGPFVCGLIDESTCESIIDRCRPSRPWRRLS